MTRTLQFILTFLVLFSSSETAGDVVFTQRGPVYGRFVSRTETHVFFRQRAPDGQYRDLSIAAADVITLVVNIDEQRLEGLDPSQPHRFREYAEELAVQKNDPEARSMATRLYLLAAFYGDRGLRANALQGLLEVVESPDQRRRIRALARLVLPNFETPAADKPIQDTSDLPEVGDEARALLDAVRQLRGERPILAAEVIDTDESRDIMQRYRHLCHWEDLLDWSIHGNLRQGDLARLLRLEVALQSALQNGVFSPVKRSAWSAILYEGDVPVQPLSFRTITEFDPAESVFREGKWRIREKDSP